MMNEGWRRERAHVRELRLLRVGGAAAVVECGGGGGRMQITHPDKRLARWDCYQHHNTVEQGG